MSDNYSPVLITWADVAAIIDDLGGMPIAPGKIIQDVVKDMLAEHVNRAVEAFENGDNIGGAQAVAQTLAVSAAWVAGTAFGWSTKLPLRGLDLVFHSFKDQGIQGKILEYMGVSSPTTRQKFLNFSKGMAFGASLAYVTNELINTINTDFLAAKTWVAPRDPLVLDLDGDGIEAMGIDPSAPVLFDHDGGGVKTATGWIKADDGILALDRDGNGLIDSGRELFGDATVMSNGQKAANGYEALADLDGNADGVINSADAAWGQLRVWRDLNQDGISQAGELKTLAELGIASLGATGQAGSVSLGGGNTQTMSGSFTKTDGSAGQSASLQLASNNFYRQFTGEVALTAEAQALPQMQGSGLVRDLQEAMSLGTAQSLALRGDMAAFAAATTRDGQMVLLDELLGDWAATSGRLVGSTYQYNMVVEGGRLVTADLTEQGSGAYILTLHPQGMEETINYAMSGPQTTATAQGQEVLRRLNVLEVFNGDKLLQAALPTAAASTGANQSTGGGGGSVAGAAQMDATLSTAQINLLNQSYESVYGALVVQTRLAPYLDGIGLVIDEAGVRFDTAGLDSLLASARSGDEKAALVDLIELNRYAQTTLNGVGYDGLGKLKGWIDALPADSALRATLAELNVQGAAATSGTAKADIWYGDGSANAFQAGEGGDRLLREFMPLAVSDAAKAATREDATKSIADCAYRSCARSRFDTQKKACGRRGLTRATSSVDRRIGAAVKAFAGDGRLNSKLQLGRGR